MAALARRRAAQPGDNGLQPYNLPRDLYQIAELLEISFGSRLDSSGRAAVREMKLAAQLGPLLWLLGLIDPAVLGLGRGYVWRAGGRVVGNVSLYRGGKHPALGPGWLIANVAVHPHHQRQGIARALMQAALDLAFRLQGQWVVLQVEADNEPALALYNSLGFERFETLAQWQAAPLLPERIPPPDLHTRAVRRRRAAEAAAEMDLIYQRARRGGITWTRPIERGDIGGDPLHGLFSSREHWVLPARSQTGSLSGVLWIEPAGWWDYRLTLFLDPALQDAASRCSLLVHALNRPELAARGLRVETAEDDPPVSDLLLAAGFRKTRSLAQMRLLADT